MTCKRNKSQRRKNINNKTMKGGNRRVEKIYINLGRQHTNPDIRGDIRIKSGPTTYDADSKLGFLSNFFEHAAKSFEEDLAVMSMGEPKSTEKQKVYKVVFYDNDEPLEEGSENPIKCKKKKDGKESKKNKDSKQYKNNSKKKRKSEKKGGVKCGQKKRKTRRIGGNPKDRDSPNVQKRSPTIASIDTGLDATDAAAAKRFERSLRKERMKSLKLKSPKQRSSQRYHPDHATGFAEPKGPGYYEGKKRW